MPAVMASIHLVRANKTNLSALRHGFLSEISGSLGDIGTLLPLMIALTLTRSISLSSTLVFTGLYNILTGIVFGVPLPVQPMKALAAVAISRRYSVETTAAAGIFVAACVLILSVTGGVWLAVRCIPVPVIKGIQVGAGLSLIISAGTSLLQPLGWIRPGWGDNLLWALATAVLLLLFVHQTKAPIALAVSLGGVVLAFIRLDGHRLPTVTAWKPHVVIPGAHNFKHGIPEAGIGQLPLTLLNSVIAVTSLSSDLLPDVPPPSETALGLSVGALNLVGCWFGAMPVCHGSGGLAAQFRFGARSGSSIILLGAFKMAVGLIWGESLVDLLEKFPKALLGVMVIAAGLTLAAVGESLNSTAKDLSDLSANTDASTRQLSHHERQKRWNVMLVTVGGILAFRNDAVGFVAGMLAWWAYDVPQVSKRLMSHCFGQQRSTAIDRSDERQSLLSH